MADFGDREVSAALIAAATGIGDTSVSPVTNVTPAEPQQRRWFDIDVLLDDNLAVGATDLMSGDESQRVACIQIEQGNAILITKMQLLELVHALLSITDELEN